MGWIVFLAFMVFVIVSGIRRAQRAGQWSWSKFAFSLGFAAVECLLVSSPLIFMNTNSPYFIPVYIATWVVALGLFVWFIIAARHWKLPDGRTSLEADRAGRQGQ
ncbi:MAG: hypothetical protein ABSA85_08870 [Terracidiphilus sp.]